MLQLWTIIFILFFIFWINLLNYVCTVIFIVSLIFAKLTLWKSFIQFFFTANSIFLQFSLWSTRYSVCNSCGKQLKKPVGKKTSRRNLPRISYPVPLRVSRWIDSTCDSKVQDFHVLGYSKKRRNEKIPFEDSSVLSRWCDIFGGARKLPYELRWTKASWISSLPAPHAINLRCDLCPAPRRHQLKSKGFSIKIFYGNFSISTSKVIPFHAFFKSKIFI